MVLLYTIFTSALLAVFLSSVHAESWTLYSHTDCTGTIISSDNITGASECVAQQGAVSVSLSSSTGACNVIYHDVDTCDPEAGGMTTDAGSGGCFEIPGSVGAFLVSCPA